MRRPRYESGEEVPLLKLVTITILISILQPIREWREYRNRPGQIHRKRGDWGYEDHLIRNRVKSHIKNQAKKVKSRFTSKKPMIDALQDNFTLFSALAAELRVQVWREAMVPRIVSAVRVPNPVGCPMTRDEFARFLKLDGKEVSPLRGINSEARVEFLKSYEVLDGGNIKGTTYFSPDIDTLYFFTSWCLRRVPRGNGGLIQKIQHLAIGFDFDFQLCEGEDWETTQYHHSYFLDQGSRHRATRDNQREYVDYSGLLLNVLEFSELKTLKLVMHSRSWNNRRYKHMHSIIVNKCQQEERRHPYEPWGWLEDRDTRVEAFVDVDFPIPYDRYDEKVDTEHIWNEIDQDKLANLMARLKEDVDEVRGPSCPPLEISAALIPL